MNNMSRFLEGVFGRGESAEEQAALAQERNAILDQGSKLWNVDLSEFAIQIGADESTVVKAMKLIADVSTPEQKQSRINALLAQIGAAIGENAARDLLNAARQGRERTRAAYINILRGPAGTAVAITALAVLMLFGPLGQAESVSAAPKAGEPMTVIPAGKDEDDEPIDAKNSAFPQATAVGKGTHPNSELGVSQGLTESESITRTAELTPTNVLTVTRFFRAEGPDGQLKSFYNNQITVESAVISETTSQSATIEFLSEGKLYTVTVALADMATTFDSSQAITRTSAELEAAIAPVEFVRRVGSTINLRTGPGTSFGLAGSFAEGSAEPVISKNKAGDWLQLPDDDVSGEERWVYAPLVEVNAAAGGSETEKRDNAIRQEVSNITGVPEDEIKLHPDYTFAEQNANPDDPTKNPPTLATDLEGNVIATIHIIKLPFGYQAEIRSWRDIRFVKQSEEEVVSQEAAPTSVPVVTATAESKPVVAPTTAAPVRVETPVVKAPIDAQSPQELQLGDPKDHSLLLDNGTEAIPGDVFRTGAGFYDVPENEQAMNYSLVAVIGSEPRTEYYPIRNLDGSEVPNAQWVVQVVDLKVPDRTTSGADTNWSTLKAITHRAVEMSTGEIRPVNNIFLYNLLENGEAANPLYFREFNSLRNERAVLSTKLDTSAESMQRFRADRDEILSVYKPGETVWVRIDFSAETKPAQDFKSDAASVDLSYLFFRQFHDSRNFAGYSILQGGADHAKAVVSVSSQSQAQPPLIGVIAGGEFRTGQ